MPTPAGLSFYYKHVYKCRGLCGCQHESASDSKLSSFGAGCAAVPALLFITLRSRVLLHGLTKIICLPSGIRSAKCWWCNWAHTTLWSSVCERCLRFYTAENKPVKYNTQGRESEGWVTQISAIITKTKSKCFIRKHLSCHDFSCIKLSSDRFWIHCFRWSSALSVSIQNQVITLFTSLHVLCVLLLTVKQTQFTM